MGHQPGPRTRREVGLAEVDHRRAGAVAARAGRDAARPSARPVTIAPLTTTGLPTTGLPTTGLPTTGLPTTGLPTTGPLSAGYRMAGGKGVSVTTAFVLGGGGVLGAHEVGMLRALSEAGIRPDLVVGTSIGAINGAFVAADPAGSAERLGELWRS